jgi:hypothetical protein
MCGDVGVGMWRTRRFASRALSASRSLSASLWLSHEQDKELRVTLQSLACAKIKVP